MGQIYYPAKVQGGEAFFVVKDPDNGKKQGTALLLRVLHVSILAKKARVAIAG